MGRIQFIFSERAGIVTGIALVCLAILIALFVALVGAVKYSEAYGAERYSTGDRFILRVDGDQCWTPTSPTIHIGSIATYAEFIIHCRPDAVPGEAEL